MRSRWTFSCLRMRRPRLRAESSPFAPPPTGPTITGTPSYPSSAPALLENGHLRGARRGVHEVAEFRGGGSAPRHVPGSRGEDSVSQGLGGNGRGADARLPIRCPGRLAGALELLGLRSGVFLRPSL